MNKTTIFNVNLQQGFILNPSGNIIAAFSNHNREIIVPLPMNKIAFDNLYSLPDSVNDYKRIYGTTDGFGITQGTDAGYKDI